MNRLSSTRSSGAGPLLLALCRLRHHILVVVFLALLRVRGELFLVLLQGGHELRDATHLGGPTIFGGVVCGRSPGERWPGGEEDLDVLREIFYSCGGGGSGVGCGGGRSGIVTELLFLCGALLPLLFNLFAPLPLADLLVVRHVAVGVASCSGDGGGGSGYEESNSVGCRRR